LTVDDWLAAVVATPGLTGIRDLADARRALVEDSLRALDVVSRFEGPIVDVGSGGGAPGIPLALALPRTTHITQGLLEVNRLWAAARHELTVRPEPGRVEDGGVVDRPRRTS